VVDENTAPDLLWMTWNLGKDREGDIILKKSEQPRLPYVCYSDDDGLTWSVPVNMPATCRTNPGVGMRQVRIWQSVEKGEIHGRLVIPANHSYDDPAGKVRKALMGTRSWLISDDHGKSWRMSSSIEARMQ
jgi:sialidase-1